MPFHMVSLSKVVIAASLAVEATSNAATSAPTPGVAPAISDTATKMIDAEISITPEVFSDAEGAIPNPSPTPSCALPRAWTNLITPVPANVTDSAIWASNNSGPSIYKPIRLGRAARRGDTLLCPPSGAAMPYRARRRRLPLSHRPVSSDLLGPFHFRTLSARYAWNTIHSAFQTADRWASLSRRMAAESRSVIRSSASSTMRDTSSPQVGMSLIRPIDAPTHQTPASTSPLS
jgi:hypothetical protein